MFECYQSWVPTQKHNKVVFGLQVVHILHRKAQTYVQPIGMGHRAVTEYEGIIPNEQMCSSVIRI